MNKYFYFLLILLLHTSYLSGQVIDDQLKNVSIWCTQQTFPDNQNDDTGTEEQVYRILEDGVVLFQSTIQQNSPLTTTTNIACQDVNNIAYTSRTYYLDAWEHDSDPLYVFNFADDSPCSFGVNTLTIDLSTEEPLFTSSGMSACTGSGLQSAIFEYAYRNAKGDSEGNPLQFSTLQEGVFSEHSNRINFTGTLPGASATADLNYTSTKDAGIFDGDNEIFYVFNNPLLSNVQLEVLRSSANGNVQVSIHPYSSNQIGAAIHVEDFDGSMAYDEDLDAGDYAIVIEGNSQDLITVSVTYDESALSPPAVKIGSSTQQSNLIMENGTLVVGTKIDSIAGAIRFDNGIFYGFDGNTWLRLSNFEKEILGFSVQSSNGKFQFAGKEGIEAATEMCKDSYPAVPTARIYFQHDIDEALALDNINKYPSNPNNITDGTQFWTMNHGFVGNDVTDDSRYNNCWCLTHNGADIGDGTSGRIFLNLTTGGNGGGATGNTVSYKNDVGCNNTFRIVCGK